MRLSTLLIGVASLLFVLARLPDIAASSFASSLPPQVQSGLTTAAASVTPILATVQSEFSAVEGKIPADIRNMLHYFLNGIASVVMVGTAATPEAAGLSEDDAKLGQDDAVRLYTTNKFYYSLGGILAQFWLIRYFYREPHRNRRKNRANAKLTTLGGFVLLVALLALPNFFFDTGVLLVFLVKLSSSLYTPALILGQFLKPYVTAHLQYCPTLNAAYQKWVLPYLESPPPATTPEVGAQVVLLCLVVGAAVFLFHSVKDSFGEEED
ncbi:hypothetical protein, conserved [Angomonas deanei]|uniref:Uncharacterized protein n=1 Tax=Angomonas deanei TaxID=59799 RepID=A0A7G2CH57_9TRYP|nr:hypothetical protein, conserved [Angomonas deanei]